MRPVPAPLSLANQDLFVSQSAGGVRDGGPDVLPGEPGGGLEEAVLAGSLAQLAQEQLDRDPRAPDSGIAFLTAVACALGRFHEGGDGSDGTFVGPCFPARMVDPPAVVPGTYPGGGHPAPHPLGAHDLLGPAPLL